VGGEVEQASHWLADWLWSVPLIMLTVALHAMGLVLIESEAVTRLERRLTRQKLRIRFAVVVSVTVLLVTILHGLEAAIWALVYRFLDALPSEKDAMLYSLNAITSFGHANLYLKEHWQLMGAMEALNGVILFGLTTAFLFTVVQGVSSGRLKKRD
jgi:MFS superfamily sulfate permease-like transporter